MLTIEKPDGTIDIEITNGCPPGSKFQLGKTTAYYRINKGEWIRNPLIGNHRLYKKAETSISIKEFVNSL